MLKIINNQIKEIYGKQKTFCKEIGIDPRDYSKKEKTAINNINWLTNFLKPLNLKIKIELINEFNKNRNK